MRCVPTRPCPSGTAAAFAARACDAFGQDLDLCKGRVVCPDAAAAFSRCTHLVINHTGTKAETPDCSRALRKLRRCLKGKGA